MRIKNLNLQQAIMAFAIAPNKLSCKYKKICEPSGSLSPINQDADSLQQRGFGENDQYQRFNKIDAILSGIRLQTKF